MPACTAGADGPRSSASLPKPPSSATRKDGGRTKSFIFELLDTLLECVEESKGELASLVAAVEVGPRLLVPMVVCSDNEVGNAPARASFWDKDPDEELFSADEESSDSEREVRGPSPSSVRSISSYASGFDSTRARTESGGSTTTVRTLLVCTTV